MATERKAWRKKNRDEEERVTSFLEDLNRKTLEENRQERLESRRKALAGGNLGALRDALWLCYQYRFPIPRWLAEGIDQALLDGFYGGKALRKWLKKYRTDMIDYSRYDAVLECRDHDLKWTDVYAKAAELLQRTSAAGTEDAIEKSYKRVKVRQRTEPQRYYLLRLFQLGNPANRK